MNTRAFGSCLVLAACAVYEPALLTEQRRGVTSGGAVSQAGSDDGGEAGERVSRGGAGTGGAGTGGTGTGGAGTGGSQGQAGSDEGGADAGGTGAADGGASSGGISSGGASTGGTSIGGTSAGGSSTGGSSTGGKSTGGSSTGGAAGAGGAKGGAGGTGGAATGGKSSGGSGGTAGSAGSTGILFSDDFQGGTASAWTPSTSGDWSVVTDGTLAYRQGTIVNSFRVASAGSSAWQNQAVQARIKVLAFGGTSASSSYLVALCARYVDEDNHYYVALRSDGKISIRRKIAGSNASIGSAITPGSLITTGTWYTVRLEVVGTTLQAYVDGVLYDTVTDTSFSAGKVAVGSTNASAVFDDVVVSVP